MALDAVSLCGPECAELHLGRGKVPKTGYVGADRSDHLAQAACGRGGPYVFERLDRAPVLSRVTRTATDVREAQRLEELANRALVVGDPEALDDHALQIDPTPAYDPGHSPVRAGLEELPDLCALLRRETGRRALGPAVQQTLGAVVIEAMDPVAQRLSVHPADPGRLRPIHPVENRSQPGRDPGCQAISIRHPSAHRRLQDDYAAAASSAWRHAQASAHAFTCAEAHDRGTVYHPQTRCGADTVPT